MNTNIERSLLQSAYQWESTTADKVYMTQPLADGSTRTYTWAQTLKEARSVANHLRSLQLPANSKIAIISKNCAHFIMSDLAIWMAGHVSVALYPTSDASTMRYILEHSDSALAFVGRLDNQEIIEGGIPDGLRCIAFPCDLYPDVPTDNDMSHWSTIVENHLPISDSPIRPADDLAVIIYTSGSTGNPKGVMHSFGSMATEAAGTVQQIKNNGISRKPEAHRMLSYLPLAHAFERGSVEATSLMFGSQVFFAWNLSTFVEDLKRAKPTVFISVPRLWQKFHASTLEQTNEKALKVLLKIPLISKIVKKKILTSLGMNSVEMAISGSAPISDSILRWYKSIGLELLEGYAQSENFNYSHLSLPGKNRIGCVGHPMPGVKTKISEEGEILVKSPANMLGYYKNSALTRETILADGFIKTGDRGEIDASGRLKITGRIKELFKTSKGKYISPAVIENKLNSNSSIELSCVSGSGLAQPFAYVTLTDALQSLLAEEKPRDAATEVKHNLESKLSSIIDTVNQSVESHESLQFVVVLTEGWTIENQYLTPTMKIKRHAIEQAHEHLVSKWESLNSKVVWN